MESCFSLLFAFHQSPNKCAVRLIFLIREQINAVECRLAFGFEAYILTLVPISNEIDEEDKLVFYHLSHTHS